MKHQQNIVKSRFKRGKIGWFTFLVVDELLMLFFLIRRLAHWTWNDFSDFNALIAVSVMIIIIGTVLLILKDFKWIKEDSEKRVLIFRNLFFPFGKELCLEDYAGFIKIEEAGMTSRYETLYLVDKRKRTRFKLNGAFYENLSALSEALELREIKKYKLSFGRYFMLLFTGRIKI